MEIIKGKYYKYNHANGFVLKALADSTSDNFRAVVVLKGNFNYEVGHEDRLWSVSCFVESDLSEFLEEANKRYPMGSQYKSVFYLDDNDENHYVDKKARIWLTKKYFGIEMGTGLVYDFKTNKWAKPVVETDYESRVSVFAENNLFNMDTNEGRLAYARKHYPIGTKYLPIDCDGALFYKEHISAYAPKLWDVSDNDDIEVGSGLIYHRLTNQWAKIIKEDKVMEKQKLSRKGLKEIHSVACSNWKTTLEQMGARNPLEDYIEISQDDVDKMFKACTKDQLPIVSKYLKQDDGSVDVTNFKVEGKGILDDNKSSYIIRDREMGKYRKKSFLLSQWYDWEIKEDELGFLCLIPTKKKK